MSVPGHSTYSLLGQVSLVLFGNANLFECLQLLMLDSLHLLAFFLDLLAHLATLLEVVQTVLFLLLSVHRDLLPKGTASIVVIQNLRFASAGSSLTESSWRAV